MSATDNAFIKAYAEELAVALGRPAKRVDWRLVHHAGAAASSAQARSGRISLSGLYALPEVLQRGAEPPPTGRELLDRISPQRPIAGNSSSDKAVQNTFHRDMAMREGKMAADAASIEQDSREGQVRVDGPGQNVTPHWHTTFAGISAPPPQNFSVAAPENFGVAGQNRHGSIGTSGIAEIYNTSSVMHAPASSIFEPQWEVDCFQWPEVVEYLFRSSAELVDRLVEKVLSHSRQGRRVIAITSFARNEGRTTLALCLARSVARRGVSVALVDGDFDHPRIAHELGLAFDTSWNEYGGEAGPGLEEFAVQSVEDNLSVLPLCANRPARASGAKERAADALAMLARAHELVLLDAGPMFTAAHRWFDRQASRCIQGALLVRDGRKVDDPQLADVVERLTTRNIHVIGLAENFHV